MFESDEDKKRAVSGNGGGSKVEKQTKRSSASPFQAFAQSYEPSMVRLWSRKFQNAPPLVRQLIELLNFYLQAFPAHLRPLWVSRADRGADPDYHS